MKYLIASLLILMSLQTKAGLIMTESEIVGDDVLVTILMDNTEPNLGELHLNLDYDVSQLTFSTFNFDYVNSAVDEFISDAFEDSGSVYVDAYWLFEPSPIGIFELGTATFSKLLLGSDLTDNAFALSPLVLAADYYGSEVQVAAHVDVPEPSTLASFVIALAFIRLGRAKKTSKVPTSV